MHVKLKREGNQLREDRFDLIGSKKNERIGTRVLTVHLIVTSAFRQLPHILSLSRSQERNTQR